MDLFTEQLVQISDAVWGLPLLILLVGTGVYLTISLRGLQITTLLPSLKLALIKRKEEGAPGDITHFQALMTALAATVGTGNIAGVATAIVAGGPGALFWMWITGLFGMATKYSEAVLAVKYRRVDALGTMSGGPMYYISKGLGWKWLGTLFAVFASISAFGIGNMVQSNSVADAVLATSGIPPIATGIVLSILTGLVIVGGVKSIGRVTQVFVPFMIFFYVMGALYIIITSLELVPGIFFTIMRSAFTPTAAAGGFVGSTVMMTIRMGIARGVFSNESGLGSSPIAAAAAMTKNPVSQALVSMTQTFIDTIIVCSLTGMVILISGEWLSGLNGAELTGSAFEAGIPGTGGFIVTLGLIFFAYSTLLGWSYYGEKSIEFLLGERSVKPYRLLFTIVVFVGAVMKLDLVWALADVMNGLMAAPNLIGLLGLSGVIISETRKHLDILLRS
ncbi:MAG: alanine/glycine:cation symporter family protein [Candidatus Glassbacteria bacterium]